MKRLLAVALGLSLTGNAYLGIRLAQEREKIEAGVHAEMLSSAGLEDLSYFLRQSGVTQARLFDLARRKPAKAHQERMPPELEANRFFWFPLEVTFSESGAIDQIKIAGDSY
jgi:hypothetical protein